MKNSRLILKTVVASFVLLAAFFVQGAVVVINKIDGAESALIRGGIIWELVIVTLLFFLIKNKSLSGLGFVKMEKGAAKRLLYFVQLLIIAFSHLLHDFCSFMSMDGSLQFEIVLGAIQFVIIVGYFIYLRKRAIVVTKTKFVI